MALQLLAPAVYDADFHPVKHSDNRINEILIFLPPCDLCCVERRSRRDPLMAGSSDQPAFYRIYRNAVEIATPKALCIRILLFPMELRLLCKAHMLWTLLSLETATINNMIATSANLTASLQDGND
jgi:hypothetical protein